MTHRGYFVLHLRLVFTAAKPFTATFGVLPQPYRSAAVRKFLLLILYLTHPNQCFTSTFRET